MLYSADYPSGKRLANLEALHEEFSSINHQKYYNGLERYMGGILKTLAAQINDGGAYLDHLQ